MGAELIVRMNGNTTYIKDPVIVLTLVKRYREGFYIWLFILVSWWI